MTEQNQYHQILDQIQREKCEQQRAALSEGDFSKVPKIESDSVDRLIQAAMSNFRDTRSMTEQQVMEVSVYAGRIYGPRVLICLDYYNAVASAAYPSLVSGIWSRAEYPSMALSRSDWMRLWKKAGFTIDGKAAERPIQAVTVYRASCPMQKRNLSGTDNFDRAKAFRRLRGPKVRIYETLVPPSRLLARIHDEEMQRGESEWIADVRGLTLIDIMPE